MTGFETYWGVTRIVFKYAFAYRTAKVVSVILAPLFFAVNYFIWTAVFTTTGKSSIAGYTLEGMIQYSLLSGLLFIALWTNVHERIGEQISSGTLSADLLKPWNYYLQHYAGFIGDRFLGFLIELIPIFIVVGLAIGFDVYAGTNIGFFILSIILAMTINFQLLLLLGMLCFWIVKPHGITRIYYMLHIFITGAVVPLNMFPDWFQKMSLVLPFQFIRYAPIRIFLGEYQIAGITFTPLQIIFYGLIHICVLALILKLIWNLALRQYCGEGQ